MNNEHSDNSQIRNAPSADKGSDVNALGEIPSKQDDFPVPTARGGIARSLSRAPVLIGILLISGGVLVGDLVSLVAPQQSQATINIVVTGPLAGTSDPGLASSSASDRDVSTQAALIRSTAIRRRAEIINEGPLPPVQTGISQGSDLVALSVVGSNERNASRAIRAYLQSFNQVLSQSQKTDLEVTAATLESQVTETADALDALDRQLADAPLANQSVIVAQQSASRTNLIGDRQAAVQQLARTQQALEALPLNVTVLENGEAQTASTGLSTPQNIMLGAAAGGLLFVIYLYRRSQRPSAGS